MTFRYVLYVFIFIFFSNYLYGFANDAGLYKLQKNLLLVVIKNNTINQTIVGYSNKKGKTFFALDELVGILRFNISLNQLKATGTFFNNSLNIDLNKDIIKVDNRKINFSPNDIILSNNRIYLERSLIESIFDIKINIDLQKLLLEITSKHSFPIEINQNKIYNRENNLNNYDLKTKHNIKYKMYDGLFSYPTADIYLNQLLTNKYYPLPNVTSYSLSLGGIFFGLDTSIYNSFSYYYNKQDSKPVTNILFSKKFFYSNSNNKIKYLAFGDISTNSTILLDNNRTGRGFFFSSLQNYSLNQNKTINLKGILAIDWEVELYEDNQLIAYRERPDSNGYYNFNNIPVYTGLNNFKLVFYGPFGEIREETNKILIGAIPVMKNEFGYTVSFLQDGKKVIENKEEYNYNKTATNTLISNMNLYYGIQDNLAINISYLGYGDNGRFYNTGIMYSKYGITFTGYTAGKENYNKNAFHYSIDANLGNLGYLYFSYDNFNNIESPASYASNMLIKDEYNIRYDNYAKIFNYFIPIYIGYKNYNYVQNNIVNTAEYNIYIRSSYSIYSNTLLTLETYYDKRVYKQYIVQPILNVTGDQFYFKGYYSLILNSNLNNYTVGLNFSYYFQHPSFMMSLQLDRMQSDMGEQNVYQVFLSKTLSLGKLGASFLVNSDKQLSVNLSYGISLGFSKNNIYYEAKSPLTNSATIMADLFIDNNNNGVYDKDIDEKINNARLLIDNMPIKDVDIKNGTIYKTGLLTYNKTKISVDMLSIDNIMLEPQTPAYHLILRPSVLDHIYFAFINTGDIEGVLINKSKLCLITEINLVDKNEKVIKTTNSDEQGLFILEKIPYGNYSLSISCQNKKRKLVKPNVVINKDIQYVKISL